MSQLTPVSSPKEEITLDPKAGFVVKSKLVSSTAKPIRLAGTKVFVNVCSDEKVPVPCDEFEPELIFPLIMENKWEIPIVLSSEKEDKDKKGNNSVVYDCCINSKAMRWVLRNKDLRLILIEWCLESIELASGLELDRDYSIPKMSSKSELSRTKLLLRDLKEDQLKKEFEKLQANDHLSLLEARKVDIEGSDGEELPSLLNINRAKGIDHDRKPLIEEIGDVSISSEKPLIRPLITKKEEVVQSKPKLNFEVSFQRLPSTNEFRLLISVTCQITSARDYDLSYNNSLHTVSLKNLNKAFKDGSLDIPLPNDLQNVSFQVYFENSTHMLKIFVKS